MPALPLEVAVGFAIAVPWIVAIATTLIDHRRI